MKMNLRYNFKDLVIITSFTLCTAVPSFSPVQPAWEQEIPRLVQLVQVPASMAMKRS